MRLSLREKKCVNCGALISASEAVCPYCGAIQAPDAKSNRLVEQPDVAESYPKRSDGRSFLLDGEDALGIFMPDRKLEKKILLTQTLATFFPLIIVAVLGISQGLGTIGSDGLLTIVLVVVTSIFVPLVISMATSFYTVRKIFKVVYVISRTRIIIPQIRKKVPPHIMQIASVADAVILGRVKHTDRQQYYSLMFIPEGINVPHVSGGNPIPAMQLFRSLRDSGNRLMFRTLMENSFRYMSLEEANKALALFNSLKHPPEAGKMN